MPTPATVYVTKRFTGGPLKGMRINDSVPFLSAEAAAKWVNAHRTRPVKPVFRGSPYVIEDASFQSFAR